MGKKLHHISCYLGGIEAMELVKKHCLTYLLTMLWALQRIKKCFPGLVIRVSIRQREEHDEVNATHSVQKLINVSAFIKGPLLRYTAHNKFLGKAVFCYF